MTTAWAALRRRWLMHPLTDWHFRFLFDLPLDGEWVALGCETTGLDTRRDRIIAIGAVRILGNRLLTSQRLELLVRPERALKADSVLVHRLREQDAARGIAPSRPCANCSNSSAAGRWWATTSSLTWRW